MTLHDVARVAGVSPITVSRVLNHPELVSPQTIKVVQQGIDRTGYVPNLVAGGLASRKTRYVAAIFPYVLDRVSETVQSLTDRLWESGYQLMLATSGNSASKEESLVAAILGRRPEGILLTGTAHTDETRRRLAIAKIPVVETWDLTPTPIDTVVGFSHEKVGEAAAEFLLSFGYSSFGTVAGDDARPEARRRAFVSTLLKHGISDVPAVQMKSPTTFQKGREAFSRLLELGALPRALFCSTDMLANGVLVEAQARGVTVPLDLAILGFGDFEIAAYTSPPLSTVRVDRAAMGRLAAEVLLARFEGQTVAKVRDIGFEIIGRGTT